jgi:hypothetical protein
LALNLFIEIVAVLADGLTRKISAALSEDQFASLKHGGELVIRGSDGREFPVSFTIE